MNALANAGCVPPAFQQVANEYQLDAEVFYAVSLAESGRQTKQYGFNVWPWALNIDDKSYYPESKEEASILIEAALVRGTKKIAVGLMQVYWAYHSPTFQNKPIYALDVGANLRAGAQILKTFSEQSGGIWHAVGHYYAGPSQRPKSRQAAAAYRERVQRLYRRYVIGNCYGALLSHR